ncbi:2-dehydropantoate 2-reductase [Spinactinospora alkalitolerans]|uniref:2-dehydropantoate 2-reductase n=1 Tax=Spinactinospora alkalitolerans TaxID=687207 RepID=A0A852TUX5_9ACTN|nr:2-dehydropantoate 2-reductase [Spinactinospora alkalitolerans]NYE48256.1 2-dehydropantoate 2-reductase [Spinactinospora alkalitolerans]
MPLEKKLTHFAVLGPGGVGGLLAGLLSREGHRVTVVASESTAQHIAAHGLRVESASFGDFTADVPAVPELTEPADVLIVATKATSLEAALRRVPAGQVRDAVVLPLLNGFEHVDLLRAHYPEAHVSAAGIRVESTRVAPGRIRQTSPFTALELARPGMPEGRIEALAERLRGTGFTVKVSDDEARTLWEKFHFLLPTALVCAHARQAVSGVRTERRDDLVDVMAEVAAVAAEYGVSLDSARVLETVDAVPPGTKPSMLRDREAGRPMEVDALGGALLRAARRVGVDVPVTARIVADLERVTPS